MAIDSYPCLPELPLTAVPEVDDQPAAADSASTLETASALETAGALRTALTSMLTLPAVSHQLDDHGLAEVTQLLLALMQHAETTTIALTTDALERGTIERSTAAGAKQWIQQLSSGAALERLLPRPDGPSTSGPLVDYDSDVTVDQDADADPSADADADVDAHDVAASAPASGRDPWSETASGLADACEGSADADTGVAADTASASSDRTRGSISGQPGLPSVPGIESHVAHRIATLSVGCRQRRNARVRRELLDGTVSPAVAQLALRKVDEIADTIPACSRDQALSYLLGIGNGATTRDVNALIQVIMATYGGADALDKDAEVQERHETVTWRDLPNGLVELIAHLSADHATTIKHAIQSLSAPGRFPSGASAEDPGSGENSSKDARTGGDSSKDARADDEWFGTADSTTSSKGPADTRSASKRRADAFVELFAIAAKAIDDGQVVCGGTPARIVVTINQDALMNDLNETASGCSHCGRSGDPVLQAALSENGDVLSPGAARQLACDAGIIPMMLNADGVPLDVGRQRRLFSRELRAAIITRDKQCTFPGCDRPPSFTQAHHLIPWWAGGKTSLDNAALLCQRHHSVVHRDRLLADHHDGRITWDLDHPGRMPLIPNTRSDRNTRSDKSTRSDKHVG